MTRPATQAHRQAIDRRVSGGRASPDALSPLPVPARPPTSPNGAMRVGALFRPSIGAFIDLPEPPAAPASSPSLSTKRSNTLQRPERCAQAPPAPTAHQSVDDACHSSAAAPPCCRRQRHRRRRRRRWSPQGLPPHRGSALHSLPGALANWAGAVRAGPAVLSPQSACGSKPGPASHDRPPLTPVCLPHPRASQVCELLAKHAWKQAKEVLKTASPTNKVDEMMLIERVEKMGTGEGELAGPAAALLPAPPWVCTRAAAGFRWRQHVPARLCLAHSRSKTHPPPPLLPLQRGGPRASGSRSWTWLSRGTGWWSRRWGRCTAVAALLAWRTQ